jgi:hypothetical protein
LVGHWIYFRTAVHVSRTVNFMVSYCKHTNMSCAKLEANSAYFRLGETEREARKAYAREKYRGPSGAIQKRKQYMKCLRSGLIRRWKESTLARHGIVFDNGDFRFTDEGSAACQPGVA